MVRNWNEQNYIRKDKSSQKCCILPRTSEFSGGGKKFYLKQKKIILSSNKPTESEISKTCWHTWWRHCQYIVGQLLGLTLSSIINGNHSYPVHVHGFQAFHTEGSHDDGGTITAGPFDAICLPNLNKIPSCFILYAWFVFWFCPS